MKIRPKIPPELDPGFEPAALWNRAYQEKVHRAGSSVAIAIALTRPDGSTRTFHTKILPESAPDSTLNERYLERILKFLLWQCGAFQIRIAGCDPITRRLKSMYSEDGERAFDYCFFSDQAYLQPLEIIACRHDEIPDETEQIIPLGRNLDGCRIGFDLGGSDRKCAALIDGKVVFSEEVVWTPYFEKDPQYHISGIQDSLKRAAAHLPRVDAIGGSSAGVYVRNEIRVASLFRGISSSDFDTRVRRIFFDISQHWRGIPFEVVNDGEVAALAGSMSLGRNSLLGVAMGTSEAVGYVTAQGNITSMLNELAFAPIDYRADAPRDEWSGDTGCGVQYLSQQAVARLAPAAGFDFPEKTPFSVRLVEVQNALSLGDKRAAKIFSTLGTYLGYAIAHYADFYELRAALLLGRVMSGEGGNIIIGNARSVLATEFPELARQMEIFTPDEREKRHGQAAAAASLPSLH
ncbi:ROK family protein [Luteolibacter algae]|uniref:ROK family protein n=1 Tax=Luteolibacter algae TaxID=454151 RepID=A0ABW5DAL2_9BACT